MEENKKKFSSQQLVPVAIIAAGLIIAGAVIFAPKLNSKQGETANISGNPPAAPSVNIKDVNLNGEPYIGSPQAPVVMAYWSDYQCPFCARFETQTLPALKTQYVDTGKLRIVFKDLQFLGPDSKTAALLGRAIWQAYPDKYFAWRQKMYEDQGTENSGWVGTKADSIASSLGMDVKKLNQLVSQNNSSYSQAIDNDYSEGNKFGIQSTPSFVLGTQLVVGAQPLSAFTQIINSELGK